MSAEYLIGRSHTKLSSPFSGVDKLFAGERIDGQSLSHANYRHCTFANISFKDATLSGGQFEDCVFVSCYFRKSTLQNTSFAGSQFINCKFPKVKVLGCDFK